MSTHLLVAAAYLEGLDPAVKLVLMAVADSADEQTLEAAPGLPKLRAWAGRSKSQVTRIVADLEAAGYVARIAPGRLGRRAVYRVFPTGVPAIPHPDEVRDRYAPTPVDNPGSYPQDEAGEGRTDAPHRGASTPSEGRTHAPPSGTTSVSSAQAPPPPPGPPVDNAPPARSPASGFPGSRKTSSEEAAAARDAARRARGAHDQPCPLHPDQIVPCGRCAYAARQSDPAKIDRAKAEARAALRAQRTPPTAPAPREAAE